MREVKYRTWDIILKKMIPWDDLVDQKNWILTLEFFKNPSYTFLQYTGLTDSNEKEIYEGDILKCKSISGETLELRVVCYDLNQAKFKTVPLSTYHSNAGNGGWTGYDLHRSYGEVVGNIFEDESLLIK